MQTTRLSVAATIYFLSIVASVISVLLVYFATFGPILTLLLWSVFYFFKRNKPYFRDWNFTHHILLWISVYIFGLMLAYLILTIIFSQQDFGFNMIIVIVVLITGMIHSVGLMLKSMKSAMS